MILDRAIRSALRLLPVRVARHLLFVLNSSPQLLDKWKYHVRPVHYYDPLPDFGVVTRARVETRRVPPSIDFCLAEQLKLLAALGAAFGTELDALAAAPPAFNFENDYFSHLDAAVYYSLIRRLKPERVVEIGCGYSTQIAHLALQQNRREGHRPLLVCIEPFPAPRLLEAKLDFELIQKPVEEVGLELFQSLKDGDVLFIDSSHVSKFASDVNREFLDILPSLAGGVWVHVHDIFFPYDYPAEWLIEKRIAFNEQYLLEAFLSHNGRFAVRLCNHWLAAERQEAVVSFWPLLRGRVQGRSAGTGSFWMQKDRS